MRGTQIKLGQAIKTARKNMKLTQGELAEKLNISIRYLQTIENESQTPSYAVLERILEVLNIPSNVVFGSSNEDMFVEKEELLYLINNKCGIRDIKVLLATTKALLIEE